MPIPREGSTAELALLTGVTPQTVNRLTEKGVLHRSARGRYVLAESIVAYVKHRERVVAEKAAGGDATYAAGLRRRVLAQAEKIETENRVRAGQLRELAEIESHWRGLSAVVRAALLGLPRKCAAMVARCRGPEEAEAVLKREIHVILGKLAAADYKPAPMRPAGNGAGRAAAH